MFDEIQNGLTAFICRCHTADSEEADVLLKEVRDRLAAGSVNLNPREVTAGNFLTTVIFSLWWDYQASITGIDCDQWCMVTAERYTDKFRVAVQCDEAEDGIAAVWKGFADLPQYAPETNERSD
jgi:hypothetical protein